MKRVNWFRARTSLKEACVWSLIFWQCEKYTPMVMKSSVNEHVSQRMSGSYDHITHTFFLLPHYPYIYLFPPFHCPYPYLLPPSSLPLSPSPSFFLTAFTDSSFFTALIYSSFLLPQCSACLPLLYSMHHLFLMSTFSDLNLFSVLMTYL